MWKNPDQEEYDSAAPAVQAHFHALRADEAAKKNDVVAAERESRLASEKFLQAAASITDKRTIHALVVLAENYEYRANEAKANLPEPEAADAAAQGPATAQSLPPRQPQPPTKQEATHDATQRPPLPSGESATGEKRADSGISAAETQLHKASSEIEELWQKLNELGLSRGGHAERTHLLASSRHLSSSLGDSFCLLPTKARGAVGIQATAVDGGSTLRAAVASRMRNQRVRLMEKQYGPRSAVDDRLRHPSGATPDAARDRASSASIAGSVHPGFTDTSRRSSDVTDTNTQEMLSHQKYEIVRLLNTVKTLSAENTKLLKKCEALTAVQEENKDLQESMDKFKTHYNQKLVMIKRALEEWRRQRNQTGTSSAPSDASQASRIDQLEEQVQLQNGQIASLTSSLKSKSEQLHRYEKWYQTLKAGAKAKQRNQLSASGDESSEANSFSSTTSFSSSSFTATSGFQDFSDTSNPVNKPPAHPTRRAL